MTDRLNEILQLLRNFQAENADIQGSAVVSIQGLPIVSSFGSENSREGIVAAMVAAILSVGARAAEELKRGTLKRVLLEGNEGLIIIQQSGPHSLLCVLVSSDQSLGLIFMLMSGLSKKISILLEEQEEEHY